jgi:serine/threonine protein kinase
MILNPGVILHDRYRIVSVLGQGGMGAVYKAIDERLGNPVAVKENLNLADEFARQFKMEAVTLASLRHPGLPHVVDYFAFPKQGQYLVMDYIDGEDLRQRIEREGNLNDKDVVLIGEAVCETLTYLHSRNPPVIHRDIKPGNIKITPDQQVYLVDFGLVKQYFGDQATTTGARAMTPGYSPPEQYGSARTDPRTDIYSLAATLYAALTGSIPEDSITRATRDVKLTPVQELNPQSSRHVATVIEKGLELKQEDRYQSADEFRTELLESLHLTSSFSIPPRVTPPPGETEIENPIPEFLDEVYSISIAEKLQKRKNWQIRFARQILIATGILAISIFGSFSIFGRDFLNIQTRQPGKASTENFSGSSLENTEIPRQTDGNILPAYVEPTVMGEINNSDDNKPQPTIEPTSLAGGGQIAFSSNRTGNFQIWIINSDGSGQRQLTGIATGACQPSWSPDGKYLAFISPCTGKKDIYSGSRIYISDADGKNLQPLSVPLSSAGDFSPVWSPDGDRIAFASLRGDSKPHIMIFDRKNEILTQVTNAAYGDIHPVWIPSGLQIAFVRQFPNAQIWVTDLTGQQQFQYSPSGAVINQWPEPNKDGTILFYSQRSLEGKVPYLVGLSYEDRGKNFEFRIPALGTEEIGPVLKPSLSPDGQWVAFESWPDGINHDIYLISINGIDRRRLTSDKDYDFDPAWKPWVLQNP